MRNDEHESSYFKLLCWESLNFKRIYFLLLYFENVIKNADNLNFYVEKIPTFGLSCCENINMQIHTSCYLWRKKDNTNFHILVFYVGDIWPKSPNLSILCWEDFNIIAIQNDSGRKKDSGQEILLWKPYVESWQWPVQPLPGNIRVLVLPSPPRASFG